MYSTSNTQYLKASSVEMVISNCDVDGVVSFEEMNNLIKAIFKFLTTNQLFAYYPISTI